MISILNYIMILAVRMRKYSLRVDCCYFGILMLLKVINMLWTKWYLFGMCCKSKRVVVVLLLYSWGWQRDSNLWLSCSSVLLKISNSWHIFGELNSSLHNLYFTSLPLDIYDSKKEENQNLLSATPVTSKLKTVVQISYNSSKHNLVLEGPWKPSIRGNFLKYKFHLLLLLLGLLHQAKSCRRINTYLTLHTWLVPLKRFIC